MMEQVHEVLPIPMPSYIHDLVFFAVLNICWVIQCTGVYT